jgi:hypothetical protein
MVLGWVPFKIVFDSPALHSRWLLLLKNRNFFNCPLLLYYPLANEVAKGYSNTTVRPSLRMLHGKKFTQWPWKSIGFQILLTTKYVPSLVKIHWRMLILECSQGCYTVKNLPSVIFKVKGQGHWVNFLPCNILVNTLESTSFNGFWPNLVHT